MKKKTKLIAIAAGATILVLGAGYTVFIAPKLQEDKWVYMESRVERGTLTVGVTESGPLDYGITTILYDLDLDISNEDEEEDTDEEETLQRYLKVEEVYVAPGQRVQDGDALVKFTEDSVEDVRKLLEGALVDAKADYNEAESEYELAVLEAKTEYDATLISQKYASEIYQDQSASVDDEITSMQIQLQVLTANTATLEEKVTEATEDYQEAYRNYMNAKETMDITDTGNAANFLTIQTGFVNARTRFRNAESALTQARENLEDNNAQIATLNIQLTDAKARRDIDKLAAEENYTVDVANGENAQIAYDAQVESLKEELQEEEEKRQRRTEQLEAFEAFVGEEGILYANGEGIVTEVGYESGERLTQAGTAVAYATPTDMSITVDVTQEDVVSLEVGNRVEIRFGAYPEELYEGIIRSIHTTATSRESATISYQVVVGVEGDTTALYGGMTADITFVTEEKEDVLYVSRKAIVEQNDKTYVYVKTALGGKELKEVQTGIRNSTSVEILSGLDEADEIYIASKVSSEEELGDTQSSDNGQTDTGMEEFNFGDGEMPGFGGGMPDFGGGNMTDFGGMGGMPDFGGGGMPDMGNMGAPGMEGRP